MQTVKLFRGISVVEKRVDEVIKEITTNGLGDHSEASWGTFHWKHQKDREKLLLKEDLSLKDTELANEKVTTKTGFSTRLLEGHPSICFADEAGAKYYAQKHNRNEDKTTPLLIEAQVDVSSIAIDGRDFLYTAFSFLRHLPPDRLPKANEILVKLFGAGIQRYVHKVLAHPKSDTNSICNLIISDEAIKIAHSQNDLIINGRYGTHFRYAFLVCVPIAASQILNVSVLRGEYALPVPGCGLENFRK